MKQSSKYSKPPHLELEPEEVKRLWDQEFYTPAGYLYHLLLAMKRAGWWIRIENVTKFCEDWNIQRRTFYRAKAKLIDSGILEENITGAIEVRLMNADECDSPDTLVTPETHTVTPETHTVTPETHTVTPETHSKLETLCIQSFDEPLRSYSDLDQISLKEKEKNEINPEFRSWLNRKADKLPDPPTFREQWIQKQAKIEANQQEFQAEQQKRKGSAVPATDIFQIEWAVTEALRQQDRMFAIAKLESLYCGNGIETVIGLINAHPDWGFAIADDGLVDISTAIGTVTKAISEPVLGDMKPIGELVEALP
jgi:hypothetical protein